MYDFILCVALASVFIGMAEGAAISSIVRSIKSGVDIPQSGKPNAIQAPRASILSKYLLLIGVWLNILIVNLEPVWNTLKAMFFFDWPDFPFTSLLNWIINSFITVIEEFIQSQVAVFASILASLVLLTIPLYFVLTASFKFLSIGIYTSRVKGLAIFSALIATTFTFILVEILSDLWDMQTITDVPLRVLQETDIFSNTMGILRFFESIFFFLGIPLGIYLVLRRKQWSGVQPIINDKSQ